MKNSSEKARRASILSMVSSIELGYMTCVFVNFDSEAFEISCFVEKSKRIPSWMELLKIISFDDMIELANPDGVKGFVHKKHPFTHKFATAVWIVHSMPLESR